MDVTARVRRNSIGYLKLVVLENLLDWLDA